MMRYRAVALVFGFLMGITATPLWAAEAYGDPFKGDGFVKDDWQVVCDNTLTCRAAGYQPESQYDMPASMLIVAKPMQPKVSAKVKLFANSEGHLTLNTATLWLNHKNYGAIAADGAEFALSPRQTEAIIGHARMHTNIAIKTANRTWQISDNGMSAVLLKLDEVQGRVGTKLALVSKTNPKRQTPKVARSKPVIHKAFAYPDDNKHPLAPTQKAYVNANINQWVDINAQALIGTKDSMGECELINPASEVAQSYKNESFEWTFTPIDANHTLASHQCWRAAYNEGYGYWLINNAKPSQPELITTSGNSYAKGQIASANKGRGIGDCWSGTVWTWNGKTFIKSSEITTGLCRGFADGGAWELPTYVTDIVE